MIERGDASVETLGGTADPVAMLFELEIQLVRHAKRTRKCGSRDKDIRKGPAIGLEVPIIEEAFRLRVFEGLRHTEDQRVNLGPLSSASRSGCRCVGRGWQASLPVLVPAAPGGVVARIEIWQGYL